MIDWEKLRDAIFETSDDLKQAMDTEPLDLEQVRRAVEKVEQAQTAYFKASLAWHAGLTKEYVA